MAKDKKQPKPKKLPAGMILRGRTYHCCFRAGGRLIRKKLSTNLQAATEILNDLRARADKADFGILDNAYAWKLLKDDFLKWAKQSVRNPEDYQRDLETFESFAKPRAVRDVTPQKVIEYREWRVNNRQPRRGKRAKKTDLKPVTARTINREIGTVSNMFNKGVEWSKIGSNPIATIKPLKHDTHAKDRRALSTEEVMAIFEASPDYLRPVWRMFLTSGIRHDELVDMRFSDIDFERKTATVRAGTAKSHKAREIPLDDTMLATITELRAATPKRQPVSAESPKKTRQQLEAFTREHVFVSQANTPLSNNLLTRFYSVCRLAKIEGAHRGGSVDIHSLRVSFATIALEAGANPKAVQAILGHATLALTMAIYAKATEAGKRETINLLPFASATGPGHVLPLEGARKALTTSPSNDKETSVG